MRFNRSNGCNVPDCTVTHGLYPGMEHDLMAMKDAEFKAFAETLKSTLVSCCRARFGKEEQDAQLYMLPLLPLDMGYVFLHGWAYRKLLCLRSKAMGVSL